MSKGLYLLTVLACVVAACSEPAPTLPSVTLARGADSPEAAVTELVGRLNRAEFDDASALAVPGHAALASLAEGVTFSQVAAALEQGDSSVAANFWAGFAQGTGSFLVGDITTSTGEVLTQDELEFHAVVVTPESGAERVMVTRDVDGFRIDLFASFGPGLANRMIPPVERLLTAQTDDARTVLKALQDVVPSLLVAAAQPGLSPAAVQDVLRLVELITRVG